MIPIFEHCPKHIYIHWPFCKNKCHYCDFVAFEKHNQYQDSYYQALAREVGNFARSLPQSTDRSIQTMYIGGGTPSLWPLPLLTDMFSLLRDSFDLSTLQEATLEVNPGGITQAHMECWRALGITRLSIGVQILDDAVLLRLNRRQKKTDVYELIDLAASYFAHLSVDLILGLPGVSEVVWWQTLDYVVAQPIDHISIYFLMIHENTPLYHRIRRGSLAVPQDALIVGLYERTVAYLAEHGFVQYEISNFARAGGESQHNKAYWKRKPYKGFGLGAASFTGSMRSVNIKNFLRYQAAHEKEGVCDESSYSEVEMLSSSQIVLEQLMLGLRTREGVGLHSVVYSLEDEKRSLFLEHVSQLIREGLLEESEGAVRLSLRGMILENEVIMRLI